MGGDNRQKAYGNLMQLSEEKGYITFDNIIDTADEYHLPINDVDWLSETLTTRGVIIYDSEPDAVNNVEEDDAYSDFAQLDYDAVFGRVLELDPSLETLISTIKKIRPPQYKEFNSLIYQAKEGNEHARNRIIEMHLRIAVRVALQRAEMYDTEISDCIGDAFEGLIVAVDKYDPDTSGPFSSYASLWIFQRISRMQNTQRFHVYYPTHKKENYFSCYPTLKDKGCISCDEIWNCDKVRRIIEGEIHLTGYHIDDVINMTQHFESFDELYEAMFLKDNDVFEKHNISFRYFEDSIVGVENVFESFISEDLKNTIWELLDTLTEKERQVIEYRFGLLDERERTLEEVGGIFGVTRERIRQIESKALRKLSHPKMLQKIRHFVYE